MMRKIQAALVPIMEAVLLMPAAAWAKGGAYGGWETYPMWGAWGVWGIGMMLMMLVVWGLVVVGLVLGIRWLVRTGRASSSDAALDILRQRYARGEIDREEFEARRRDLI